MRRLKIYLDTSVVNFVYADDAPDLQRITVAFFEYYASQFDLFVSEVVLQEIGRDPDAVHRGLLEEVLRRHAPVLLDCSRRDEVHALVSAYVQHGVFSAAKLDDALHAAYATVYEMDILLSWNFKHLANIRKEGLIQVLNTEQGYRHPLRIVSPTEVEYE
jgi:hypothetical protein